uniref:EF-hand domain-containing protein n=1 Tax=Xenopus tropicalis TaxID=8364 RepID=A0A6I8R3Z8_XENTR
LSQSDSGRGYYQEEYCRAAYGQQKDPMYGYYASIADQNSQVDTCGISSKQVGLLMISTLDRDIWRQHFIMDDTDGSGTVQGHGLHVVSRNIGILVEPSGAEFYSKRSSRNGRSTFDYHIDCCVKLSALRDTSRREVEWTSIIKV